MASANLCMSVISSHAILMSATCFKKLAVQFCILSVMTDELIHFAWKVDVHVNLQVYNNCLFFFTVMHIAGFNIISCIWVQIKKWSALNLFHCFKPIKFFQYVVSLLHLMIACLLFLNFIFMQVEFVINVNNVNYKFYHGDSETVVYNQRSMYNFDWLALFSSSGFRAVCLSPSRRSCVGIDTTAEYKVRLSVIGRFII